VEITAQSGTNMVIPLYQESVQVSKRTVDAGAVRLRKKVTTETVNQPVELRTETLVIDRVPTADSSARNLSSASGASGVAQPFQEGEMVIRLQREEPVVEKRMAPAGSIVAEVKPQTQQTTIQSQVRREDVDISKIGDPQNVIISRNVSASTDQSRDVGGAAEIGGQEQGRGASTADEAITDLTTLITTPSSALTGRQVRLSGIPVQRVIGNQLIAVGTENDRPLYIRLSSPNPDLSQGSTVNVTGVMHPVPASLDALGLADEASQILRNQPVYLEAQRVEKAK
jgi:stress response protein YsnF